MDHPADQTIVRKGSLTNVARGFSFIEATHPEI